MLRQIINVNKVVKKNFAFSAPLREIVLICFEVVIIFRLFSRRGAENAERRTLINLNFLLS